MIIGSDFDNTIVCYDDVIRAAALERKLIPGCLPPGKGPVRDHLRAAGREDDWTELQGYVYGPGMKNAAPFPGALEVLSRCAAAGHTVLIISHRTRHPYLGEKHDLHAAARAWMEDNGLFDPALVGLKRENVFLELTKKEKLQRIGETACGMFIDDLPEFLSEPDFPPGVERILFDPNNNQKSSPGLIRVSSWREIERHVLGSA